MARYYTVLTSKDGKRFVETLKKLDYTLTDRNTELIDESFDRTNCLYVHMDTAELLSSHGYLIEENRFFEEKVVKDCTVGGDGGDSLEEVDCKRLMRYLKFKEMMFHLALKNVGKFSEVLSRDFIKSVENGKDVDLVTEERVYVRR